VPLASFAVGWFLVALVIEQGVLPIDLTFEQRLYLPSVGPLIALSWGLARLTAGWRLGPWPVAAPLVAALALATHARNEAWRDPLVLLSQPGNQPRVLLTVGALLAERGRLAQAEAAFLQLAEAEPGNVGALFNLAVLARQRGDVAGARALARRAVEVAPDKVETWLLVALEAASAGDRGAAADALGRALRIQPGYPPALDLQRQLGLPAAPSSHGR
jgi:tetratricopeptide (TPR) repeat protein